MSHLTHNTPKENTTAQSSETAPDQFRLQVRATTQLAPLPSLVLAHISMWAAQQKQNRIAETSGLRITTA